MQLWLILTSVLPYLAYVFAAFTGSSNINTYINFLRSSTGLVFVFMEILKAIFILWSGVFDPIFSQYLHARLLFVARSRHLHSDLQNLVVLENNQNVIHSIFTIQIYNTVTCEKEFLFLWSFSLKEIRYFYFFNSL